MGCAKPNPIHWHDLRARPAESILSRGGVKISPNGRGYEVSFLDAAYFVDPISEHMAELTPWPERPLAEEFQILLIRYLVAEEGGALDGREISEKDLPGGVTFFRGPHALHVAPIVQLFGDDESAFEARGRALGGVVAPYGDKAIRFSPFPAIPVTYVLWKADEEFPASVSVLFDRSIGRWLELDMIFTLVLVLTERIAGR